MRYLGLIALALTAVCFPLRSQSADSVPQRIISTAPSITEMLFRIGAGERLVGVTSYCDYPPEAKTKRIIGDFASPSIESILQLKPDLVVLLEGRSDLLDKIRPFSIPILVLGHQTVDEILESLSLLGRRVGAHVEAERLRSELESDLKHIRTRIAREQKPRVLFLVSRSLGSLTEIYSVSDQSYIGQLIELAGGNNVFKNLSAVYPKVSIEEIMARNPQIIIDMSQGPMGGPESIQQTLALWDPFPSLEAVRNKRVYVLDSDVFIIPGPRIVEAANRLSKVFHAERF